MGHTGVCTAQIPTSKTHQAQKNERPETKLTCFYSYQKHTNTPTPRVSPPSPFAFWPKAVGFQGQEITIPPSFPTANDFIPQCVKVYFLGVCSSWGHRLLPCALICLAGSSPVAELFFSSDVSSSVVPSLMAFVYWVDQY